MIRQSQKVWVLIYQKVLGRGVKSFQTIPASDLETAIFCRYIDPTILWEPLKSVKNIGVYLY